MPSHINAMKRWKQVNGTPRCRSWRRNQEGPEAEPSFTWTFLVYWVSICTRHHGFCLSPPFRPHNPSTEEPLSHHFIDAENEAQERYKVVGYLSSAPMPPGALLHACSVQRPVGALREHRDGSPPPLPKSLGSSWCVGSPLAPRPSWKPAQVLSPRQKDRLFCTRMSHSVQTLFTWLSPHSRGAP